MKLNDFEKSIIEAMHCEHCGYGHSKKYLKDFYTNNNFKDENSGCIKIGDYGIFFKMESHNHPCAIEPYQGSMTGIGGIVRDVLALGARPIALLNSLKFSKLDENKTKYYLEEVVRGISDYGNSIGVATIGGETIFDKRFRELPIVNVLALGIARLDEIKLSSAKPDALIVLLGSKTGIDGLGGATFASDNLSEKSSRSSVQIGDPYTKKKLIEAVLELIKHDYVIASQDLGASGILSSTSEMGYKGKCEIELYLDKVHTQIPDITPLEIMLSESQERMMFVVKKEGIEEFSKIAKKYELEFSIIGKTKKGSKYKIYNNNKLLCDLDLRVLCEPELFDLDKKELSKKAIPPLSFSELIKNDNFSSKKYIYSQFDQEVQGRTSASQKENSIGVLYLKETDSFIALDTKTFLEVDGVKKAFYYLYRKLAGLGFEPEGITNCLNFANPNYQPTQSEFLEAVEELKELSHFYKVPVVSGNVSFYNETKDAKIPPCATLAMVGSAKTFVNYKITKGDKIFYLKTDDLIFEKQLIKSLIEKGLIKKAFPINQFGLLDSLLKQSLFYNLGFKIKKDENISFVLLSDKQDELEAYLKDIPCCFAGEIISDKIIFDNFSYDRKKIQEIFENKIEKNVRYSRGII